VDQAALDAAVADYVTWTYEESKRLLARAKEITSTGAITPADMALVFQSQATNLMHQAHIEVVRNYVGRATPTKPEPP
jgi:iron uptake system EfeUOB component EfeO/EfeM